MKLLKLLLVAIAVLIIAFFGTIALIQWADENNLLPSLPEKPSLPIYIAAPVNVDPAPVAINIESVGVSIYGRDFNGNKFLLYDNVTAGGYMPNGNVYFHYDNRLIVVSDPYIVEYYDTTLTKPITKGF